jgi:hypothetical protein
MRTGRSRLAQSVVDVPEHDGEIVSPPDAVENGGQHDRIRSARGRDDDRGPRLDAQSTTHPPLEKRARTRAAH